MDTEKDMSRRAFLKDSILAGGSLMLSGILPLKAGNYIMQERKTDYELNESDSMLKGICDIHIHAAPDSRMRSVDEWHFAQEAQKAGYRAIMYKSNDFSCHDRAFLIRQGISDIEVFGSLCMNRVHGDRVNAYAAEKLSLPPEACVVAFGCQHWMRSIIIDVKGEKKKAFLFWTVQDKFYRKLYGSWKYVPRQILFLPPVTVHRRKVSFWHEKRQRLA